jgi:transposase
MTQPSTAPNLDPAAWVGIDWADQSHAVCLSSAEQAQPEEFQIKHTPESIAEFVAMLRTRFGGRPVAVALEQSRGALLDALMSHEFLVLYPVNPASAKHYRDAFAPSGAKNDPVDARLLWEFLVKHRDQLRAWQPDDAATRQLALLCEHRREFVSQQTRTIQQLRAALKNYFPQALDWAGEDLATGMAADFLQKWSSLDAIQSAKPQTVRAFYYAHRCRRPDLVTQRLAAIKSATALTTDPAVVLAHALRVEVLARQLRTLLADIRRYDQRIAVLFADHPDAVLFKRTPGAGACLAPRLIAAFGSCRDRFPNANAMQCFSGVAPVTRQSGKFHVVSRRYACPKFVLQTFHELARCSLKSCDWARACYQARRNSGKGHHAAIRAVAFKWVRILWRCWRDRTPYDDVRYAARLRRAGSPFAKALEPRPAM